MHTNTSPSTGNVHLRCNQIHPPKKTSYAEQTSIGADLGIDSALDRFTGTTFLANKLSASSRQGKDFWLTINASTDPIATSNDTSRVSRVRKKRAPLWMRSEPQLARISLSQVAVSEELLISDACSSGDFFSGLFGGRGEESPFVLRGRGCSLPASSFLDCGVGRFFGRDLLLKGGLFCASICLALDRILEDLLFVL